MTPLILVCPHCGAEAIRITNTGGQRPAAVQVQGQLDLLEETT